MKRRSDSLVDIDDDGEEEDEVEEDEKKDIKVKVQSAFAVILDEGVRPRLVTFVPELDRLLGGGVPTSSITELCLWLFCFFFFCFVALVFPLHGF